MKTFTFRYDPSTSLKKMFDEMNVAVETRTPHVERDLIVSQSIEGIFNAMNKSRLDLFYCIAKEKPGSLYQLSKLLERDYSNVLRDSRALEGIGLIELKSADQEGGREKLTPIALYDRIVFDFGSVLRAKKPLKEKPSKKKTA